MRALQSGCDAVSGRDGLDGLMAATKGVWAEQVEGSKVGRIAPFRKSCIFLAPKRLFRSHRLNRSYPGPSMQAGRKRAE